MRFPGVIPEGDDHRRFMAPLCGGGRWSCGWGASRRVSTREQQAKPSTRNQHKCLPRISQLWGSVSVEEGAWGAGAGVYTPAARAVCWIGDALLHAPRLQAHVPHMHMRSSACNHPRGGQPQLLGARGAPRAYLHSMNGEDRRTSRPAQSGGVPALACRSGARADDSSAMWHASHSRP